MIDINIKEKIAKKVNEMCSGPGFSLVNVGDEERILAKKYKCHDCENTFKGFGVMPICPKCDSRNLMRVK